MLTYLLWTLLTSRPDHEKLVDAVGEHVAELAMKIKQDIELMRNSEEEIRKLVEIYFEALPQAIA